MTWLILCNLELLSFNQLISCKYLFEKRLKNMTLLPVCAHGYFLFEQNSCPIVLLKLINYTKIQVIYLLVC